MNDYRLDYNKTTGQTKIYVRESVNVERHIATCPTKRFAQLVVNGIEWMECEGGTLDWSVEAMKP